jgi:hypothetical protein
VFKRIRIWIVITYAYFDVHDTGTGFQGGSRRTRTRSVPYNQHPFHPYSSLQPHPHTYSCKIDSSPQPHYEHLPHPPSPHQLVPFLQLFYSNLISFKHMYSSIFKCIPCIFFMYTMYMCTNHTIQILVS